MLIITYAAAVLAAALNAIAAVIQRTATNKPDASHLFSHHFAYEMAKNKLFLIGIVPLIAAFVFQAIALKDGPLSVVEPLLTSDLIFLLALFHWYLKIKMKLRDWLSAIAIMVGLSGMLIAANPRGGHLNYHATPWIILISILGPISIALAIIIRKLKSPTQRAFLAGLAAAATFALNAAFTKLSLNILDTRGVVAVLLSWPLYGLIITGIISAYLMLNAFGSGPLAISQPTMEVFEPTIASLYLFSFCLMPAIRIGW